MHPPIIERTRRDPPRRRVAHRAVDDGAVVVVDAGHR